MQNFLFVGLLGLIASSYAQETTLAGTATMTVNKPSKPDVYNGEKLKFECDFQTAEALDGPPSDVTIRGTTEGSTEQWYVGCTLARLTGTYSVVTNIVGSDVSLGMLTEVCSNLPSDVSNTYNLQVEVTVKKEFECECYLDTGDSKVLVSASEKLPALKTAPQNLKIEITPTTFLVSPDDTFEVRCTSEGGVPASVFKYGIGDDELNSMDSIQVAPEYNGKKVWCYDETHNNLNGGDTAATRAEQELTVYYLQVEPEQTRLYNPDHNNPLLCNSQGNLPPNVTLMYRWMKDDVMIKGETNKEYTVTRAKDSNETSTMYKCSVFTTNGEQDKEIMDKLGEQEISFNVTWSEDAVTIPTTTEKPEEKPTVKPSKNPNVGEEEKGDKMMIVIIIVVIVVVVVIIIIVVIVVIKKRAASGSENLKKEKTTSDTEKGSGEGAAEPMLPSGESKPAETGTN